VSLHFLDYVVLGLYGLGIAILSWVVSKKQKTTDDYFVAGRSMPAWAVAMALMAALISSNTVIGHPATVYQKGMILLLGNASLLFVLIFVARYIVPFYRHVIGMSAYEYIGARFGVAGRLYASAGFVASCVFDLGLTLLTTAIALNIMTGWSLTNVLLWTSGFTIVYTMIGGMRAVVWSSVIQGSVLIGAALMIIARLVFAPEVGPPGAVLGEAWRAGKFDLGSFDFSWSSLFDTTVTSQWLFLLAYLANWCRRYIADQHMVQRYLIARTDRAAASGAFWNGFLCVPIWAIFMLIGACLYGYYQLSGSPGPALSDNVVPHFIVHHLPAGVVGLVLAAIIAATMSSISADLNSIATVLTTDHIGHFFPNLRDRVQLLLGRILVVVSGILATAVGLYMRPTEGAASIMERGVTVAAVLSGGTLGLFFLGFLTRRATRQGCYVGIAACAVFTAWGLLTEPKTRVLDLGFNFEMNPILIGVFGHVVLFVVGYAASLVFGGYRPENVEQLTFRRKYLTATPETSAAAANQTARS
jgi:SSS family solute:Na+ symporter